MPAEPFQYAVIRVIPNLERGESINAGVIVYCRATRYLAAKAELDRDRLAALDRTADAGAIEAQLERIVAIAAGDPAAGAVAQLPQSERYHWLVAPASTTIQASDSHTGICAEPDRTLEHLFDRLVRR